MHAVLHGLWTAWKVGVVYNAQTIGSASHPRKERKRVARLMRIAGLRGANRRRWPRPTRQRAEARRAQDLVGRHFNAEAANVLRVADATYTPTGEGFLYLAVVLDVFSRRIEGWAMRTICIPNSYWVHRTWRCSSDVMKASFTTPTKAAQYTSIAFGRRCREAGVQPSMGTAGDAYDTRCANRSSAHWKRSCSRENTSRPTNRPGGALSHFWRAGMSRMARMGVGRLEAIQTPDEWMTDQRYLAYGFRCLVLNEVDVTAPRWKREWLDPTADYCSAHHSLLAMIPASIFRKAANCDAALRAISRYRTPRFPRNRRLR